ncbi:MAG: hypothetical protein L6R41_004709, partial [Letrouitia leprolyta]
MGKDLDSQWVHLLAVNRRNINGPSLSRASQNTSERKQHARSRSSATSYFALLSAGEHGSSAGRSSLYTQKASNIPSMTTRDMDSSWVAWFTERWQQRQLVDDTIGGRTFPDRTIYTSSELAVPKSQTLSHPVTRQQQQQQQQQLMQQNNHPTQQDQEDALLFNHTTPATSEISSAGTTSPVPSPHMTNLDLDMDNLDTFLSTFCTASSFPAVPALTNPSSTSTSIQQRSSLPPSTNLDNGDFTWLEDQPQQPHTFPLPMSGGGREESGVSSTSPG